MSAGVGTPGPRRGGAPYVFVADLTAPELEEGDLRHLERSLRLRSGDPLTLGDGAGSWRSVRFGDPLEATSDVVVVEAARPAIGVAFALVKGGRPELVVQKLTELGVDTIAPFHAERSVVRWDADRALRNHERLERVAREAAMQSGRVWLPTVAPLADFADVAVSGAALADPGGDPPALDMGNILIGPEGGWSPAEQRCDLPRVMLPGGVLRAETAAITAGALFAALRSGLVAQRRGGADSRAGR